MGGRGVGWAGPPVGDGDWLGEANGQGGQNGGEVGGGALQAADTPATVSLAVYHLVWKQRNAVNQ